MMRSRWRSKFPSGGLAYNTAWMSLSQGVCLTIQAAYFVITARCLAAENYGAFVATMALALTVAPFVGFGWGDLLVKHVAQDRTGFRVYWGNLLSLTVVSGLLSTGILVTVARIVLPQSIPILVIIPVCLSELVFSRVNDCVPYAFQSVERLDLAALQKVAASLARFTGILVLSLAVRRPTSTQWSFVYLLTTFSISLPSVVWVSHRLGSPVVKIALMRRHLVQGACFAVSGSAQIVHDYIDQTMLARLASLDATAVYSIAARLVEVGFIPIRSVLNAAYPGFFRAGRSGIRPALQYMSRILPRSAAYSIVVSGCLYVCSPLVPHVFGPQYRSSVGALRILALLPVFRTFYYFLADAITSTGRQGLRTCIQVVVATCNIALNLWAIPRYSWTGAAWSSVASDGLLAVSMYCVVLYFSRSSEGKGASERDACGPESLIEVRGSI